MSTLIDSKPDGMRSGVGWTELEIADLPTMWARRWRFEPGAQGPEQVQGESDQLLYVIRGSGTALVDGQDFPLETESMLWLEPGETYRFVAGDDGLEILQGQAPADQD